MKNLDLKIKLNAFAINHLEDLVSELKDEVKTKLRGDGNTDEGGFAGNSGDYSAQATNNFLSEQASIRRAEAEQYQVMVDKMKLYRFEQEMDHVELLSLIDTNRGLFFINQPVKPLEYEGIRYFFLATDAPIYRELHGKVAGDAISFRGIEYKINSVC